MRSKGRSRVCFDIFAMAISRSVHIQPNMSCPQKRAPRGNRTSLALVSRFGARLPGEKSRIRLQVLDGDWDLHSNACARLRTAYVSRKGSRGGAEPRSNQNYHQGHEGHEEGVARECAQNIIVCFVLFVVNNPLASGACPPAALRAYRGAPPR